jgi:hypothetical protein
MDHFGSGPEMSVERMMIYVEHLADIPTGALEAGVNRMIATRQSPWFPTVAEIRAAVLDYELPNEAAALEQVEARVRLGVESPLHPLVKRALDLVGGVYSYRTAEEPTVIRGQFLRLYRSLREDAVQDASRALPSGEQQRELTS